VLLTWGDKGADVLSCTRIEEHLPGTLPVAEGPPPPGARLEQRGNGGLDQVRTGLSAAR